MSWDTVPGRNGEGYPDPTASTALARVQHSQKGLQSKRAGEHFENMITASLNWYCDKGVAFVEKTPEPMKPLRKPDRQGRFLACYTKAGQPDFKGTLTGGRAVVFEAKHFTPDDDGLKQDWGGIACFAIRHTAEQSPTGYAKATKKAGSPAPPWLCSFLRGLTRHIFTTGSSARPAR